MCQLKSYVLKVALKWGDHCDGNKTKLGKLCSHLRLCQLSAERLFSLKEYFTFALDEVKDIILLKDEVKDYMLLKDEVIC